MLPFGQLVVGRKAAIGGVTGCLLLLAVGLLSRRQQDVAPEAAARPIFLAAKHNATKIGNGTGHAEACRNAEPGEACYGAAPRMVRLKRVGGVEVLWHKWIGLVEQPNSYVNLTRPGKSCVRELKGESLSGRMTATTSSLGSTNMGAADRSDRPFWAKRRLKRLHFQCRNEARRLLPAVQGAFFVSPRP